MYTKGGRKYPINKALFESWSVALTHYDKSILKTHKNEIVNQFVHLIQNDSEFEKSISQGTGSVSKVKQRFYKIEKLLDGIIR
jgi:K+/H+ antiporter YhaU regulatory subunit KhtT